MDNTLIQQLKQTNISTDSEKTSERVKQAWKSASATTKDEVMALADVALSTIQRAYRTGSLSAKLAVALAQVLKVNPFYLTAETDEAADIFDEQTLNAFLIAHGYEALATAPKARRRRTKAAQTESNAAGNSEVEPKAEPEVAPIFIVEVAPSPAINTELCDADVLTLLHALQLKASFGAEEAGASLRKLYDILLG